MALSADAKRAVNDALVKLLSSAGMNTSLLGNDAFGSLSSDFVSTVMPLDLYVSATGSDSNSGTQAAPFKTLQAAINSIPKRIRHPVSIKVGPGSFDGAQFNGFIFDPANSFVGSYLWVEGTFVNATVTTGTATGTATATTNGANQTFGTLTDSTQAWTTDDLKGKLIEVLAGTGTGTVAVIVSNTATSLTIAGTWTVGSGLTYAIRDCATSIDSNVFYPRTTPNGNSSAFSRLGISGMSGAGKIILDKLKFSAKPLVVSGGGSVIAVSNSMITSAADGTFGMDGGHITLTACSWPVAPLTLGMVFPFKDDTALTVRASNCALFGSGVNFSVHALANPLSACGYFGCFADGGGSTTSTAFKVVSAREVIISGCVVKGFGFGVDGNPHNFNASTRHSAAFQTYIDNSDFSNISTAFNIVGPGVLDLVNVTGTGNIVAISANKGASVRVNTACTITGTTEIQIDGGAAQTLAGMRAATPRVLNNTSYFTKVYEGY